MKCMSRGTEFVNAGCDGYTRGTNHAIHMTDAIEILHFFVSIGSCPFSLHQAKFSARSF